MAKEKKKPTLISAGMELAGVGVSFGLGAQLAGATGPVGKTAAKGLSTGASLIPAASVSVGGGILAGQLGNLQAKIEVKGKKQKRREIL